MQSETTLQMQVVLTSYRQHKRGGKRNSEMTTFNRVLKMRTVKGLGFIQDLCRMGSKAAATASIHIGFSV